MINTTTTITAITIPTIAPVLRELGFSTHIPSDSLKLLGHSETQ